MRITAIEAIPVRVPVDVQRQSSLGRFEAYEYAVVIVHADNGLEGIGEISTLWDGAAVVQCAILEHALAPALVGLDPRRINEAIRRMKLLKEAGFPARAGVEMALLDLSAKAAQVPVYELLGGATRSRIRLSRSVHMAPIDVMRDRAAIYAQDGFSCVKVKVGRSLREDVAAVRAIRDVVGPDVLIRVDANMGWSTTKEAIYAIDHLSEFDLHSVEQPIPPGRIDEMRLLRTMSRVPIMADESVWGPSDAWELLKAGAVDFLNIYVAESGGLTNSALIFQLADLAGVRCVIGAMPELGIGTAAAIHLGAAVTYLDDPCDASGAMYQDHDVIMERFDISGGFIEVPDRVGLGVTLDPDRVAEFRSDMTAQAV